MKSIYSFKIILLSLIVVSCGKAEFSKNAPLLNLGAADEATEREAEQVAEQILDDIGEIGIHVPETVQEVLPSAPTPALQEKIETYICNHGTERSKENENKRGDTGFVRVGDGSYLQSKDGPVRSGLMGSHEGSSQKTNERRVKRYMICKLSEGKASQSLCLTKAKLKVYKKRWVRGQEQGYMGPCR